MGSTLLTADNQFIAFVSEFTEWQRFPCEFVKIVFEPNDPELPVSADNYEPIIKFVDMLKSSTMKFRAIRKQGSEGYRTTAYEYELEIRPPQRFEHYYHDFPTFINNNKIKTIQIRSGIYGNDNTISEDMLGSNTSISWDIENYELVPDDDHSYTEITIKGLAPASHFSILNNPFKRIKND